MGNPLDRLEKLHSRLRCVANGKTEINAVRAQRNGAVRVTPSGKKAGARTCGRDAGGKPQAAEISSIERGSKQTKLPDDVEVSVFVLFNQEDAKTPNLVTRRNGRVGSATVTLSQLASSMPTIGPVDRAG